MDDGARSVEESQAMLIESARQGVARMVATPHFYGDREDPASFLARRAEAVDRLLAAPSPTEPIPEVCLGAEVAFFRGMAYCEELEDLRIRGTRLILIEMPFYKWGDEMISELIGVKDRLGLDPILAHIERYDGCYRRWMLEQLLEERFLIQSNGEAFLERKSARGVLKMFRSGMIQLLGSDCHRIDERTPNLGSAVAAIAAKCGDEEIGESMNFAEMLLQNAETLPFPSKSE